MYGRLTMVTGPMYSGKTSHLVKTVRARDDSIVFKPAMDIRYAEEECVTHTGDRVNASPVALPDDML
ncbi:MAG: thymidine kinase, partial [Sphingobacteriales bacterium]